MHAVILPGLGATEGGAVLRMSILATSLSASSAGQAGAPGKKTGGSIFCTQMSLNLILETSERRPCVDRSSKICISLEHGVELIARRWAQVRQGLSTLSGRLVT